MEDNGTIGISDTKGFQPVAQGQGAGQTNFHTDQGTGGNDRMGIRHWPTLFQYLEDHFMFSASLLSLIGYVVMASFGAMENLGQYVGYILFLGGVVAVYNFNERKKTWVYIFISSTAVLMAFVLFQNWDVVAVAYRNLNHPFQIDSGTQDTTAENLIGSQSLIITNP